MFNYEDFIQRNIGFISEDGQATLRRSKIFIAGVGGMGGAALLSLVRAGVGEVWIADFDTFEVSNFNRQVFANLDYVGKEKVLSTVEQIRKINPEIIIRTFDEKWVLQIDEILRTVDVAINGCDDTRASIILMRKGKEHRKVVIDAFASPLPSVYVVRPQDPRPEEFMKYPTVGLSEEKFTPELLKKCFEQEMTYILINSTSQDYVELGPAKELLEGKRKRFSFAPMVIATGTMMSFEALKVLLKKESVPLYKGYFFNPWNVSIEKPAPFWLLPYRMLKAYLFFKKMFG